MENQIATAIETAGASAPVTENNPAPQLTPAERLAELEAKGKSRTPDENRELRQLKRQLAAPAPASAAPANQATEAADPWAPHKAAVERLKVLNRSLRGKSPAEAAKVAEEKKELLTLVRQMPSNAEKIAFLRGYEELVPEGEKRNVPHTSETWELAARYRRELRAIDESLAEVSVEEAYAPLLILPEEQLRRMVNTSRGLNTPTSALRHSMAATIILRSREKKAPPAPKPLQSANQTVEQLNAAAVEEADRLVGSVKGPDEIWNEITKLITTSSPDNAAESLKRVCHRQDQQLFRILIP